MTDAASADVQSIGHRAHSKATEEIGLPGIINRPIKVTMIGAGSGFTPTLINDILRIPGEAGGTIALVDLDNGRLETMHKVISNMAEAMGKGSTWKVVASNQRCDVLAGTDYIINCIEVSGIECVRFDNDIPAKYGIDQCIGDTIGPGGLFKSLRTVPVWLEILKDAERLCPQAIVLNYTNPMNIMCLAAGRASSMQVVGLCHSVQGTSHVLAKRAGVPYKEMLFDCAGINHLAWFTKLEHKGKDLYPALFEKARRDFEGTPDDPEDKDLVRKDMMLHFGAFITESSGHLSEYLPYYRKRKDLLDQYTTAGGYEGGSYFYADHWPSWRAKADTDRMAMVRGEIPYPNERSWEYGSFIIEAREKDTPFRIYGNVMNSVDGAGQLITNLPADGCVELSCMVDQAGINPTRFGKLPPQMAAVCASNMHMFDLATTAILEHSKEAAIHALLLDPLTAAVCSPAEIKKMTLEMFEAEKDYLVGYK